MVRINRTSLLACVAFTLSFAGCVHEPEHVATGSLTATGRDVGTWQTTKARCSRDRSAPIVAGAEAPVVLVFSGAGSHAGRERETIIEIPYEPTPAHVDVVVAPASFTFTRRACNQFEAHVDGQALDGVPGTFARGSLRLSCPLRERDGSGTDGTFDVVVDFDQC
jgi:hypothetical protein